MRVRHCTDTDTLSIEMRPSPNVDTCDVDQDTLVEIDAAGSICAITIEHAWLRTDQSSLYFERITA